MYIDLLWAVDSYDSHSPSWNYNFVMHVFASKNVCGPSNLAWSPEEMLVTFQFTNGQFYEEQIIEQLCSAISFR